MLAYLIRHRQRLVPKDELLRGVWRTASIQEGALVRCISAARRAIGDSTREQPCIVTHYRVGYSFQGDVDEQSPTVSSAIPPPDLPTLPRSFIEGKVNMQPCSAVTWNFSAPNSWTRATQRGSATAIRCWRKPSS